MSDYWIAVEDSLPNKDSINEYLSSLKIDNRSILTIKEYKRFLVSFFKEVPKDIKELNKTDVLDWLSKFSVNKKESSVLTSLNILSAYLKYCLGEGYVERNIIVRRWKPKVPKPLPKYLQRTEVTKIRMVCEKECIRDRLVFELLLTSGCRVREAVNINIEDIDLYKRTIKVTGKRRKIRFVYFNDYCAILMENYLKSHSEVTSAFFVGNHNKRLDTNQVWSIFHRLGVEAGLVGNLYPHRMRHTFATQMLENGASLDTIQEMLGHANLETTTIYAYMPLADVESLYHKCMG